MPHWFARSLSVTAARSGDFEFLEATVRSRGKLSYYAVDRYISGQYDELMSHSTPLETLYQIYRALRSRREEQGLVMEDRQDFRWILNDNKQIESIEPSEKLLSQKLVEECMVAANHCAARFLIEHNASGPFVSHPGFRADRRDEVNKFLTLHAPELAALDTDSVSGYRDIMRGLATPDFDAATAHHGQPSVNPSCADHQAVSAHGAWLCPATRIAPLPLRKYSDFLVHLQIKAALNGASGSTR